MQYLVLVSVMSEFLFELRFRYFSVNISELINTRGYASMGNVVSYCYRERGPS